MAQAWVVLTRTDGRDLASPSDDQLAGAIAQVFAKGGPAEGGPVSAVLRVGYDDGLMYEMEVAGDGAVRFEEWSDRDCEIALASPRHMRASQAEALQLWRMMAQRQVAKIRSQPWQ